MGTVAIKTPPGVDILLSTYNGESYLSQLLDSILAQSYLNWRLLIRDDGSSDSTVAILKTYISRYPHRFELIEVSKENIGCTNSFFQLLERSRAEYIAFCDQDDVWLPEKLSVQISEITALERCHGKSRPILVHSDLQIYNKDMQLVSNSFWQFQHIAPDKMKDIKYLLVHNFVTGCTILINRALREITLPVNEKILIYDWWLGLLALEQGKIFSIDLALVKYRQHSGNTIGAQKWGCKALRQFFKDGHQWRQRLRAAGFK